jgi:exodeoxyribonuclease VII small subunit
MTKQVDYKSLQTELDEILDNLQNDDIDVDEALKSYERGLIIIKDLEKYLSNAENTVKELKAKFNTKA